MRLDYDPGADMDEPRACKRCSTVCERAEMVSMLGRTCWTGPGAVLLCRRCYDWVYEGDAEADE